MPIHENMSDDEVGMLIRPGFSTAEQVTDAAWDAVRRRMVQHQEMGGHVEIQSKQGQGTTIRILLPLTLAILDGCPCAWRMITILPLNAVMESLQPREEDLHPLAGGERVLEVRGEYLPLVELWKAFEVEGAKTGSGLRALWLFYKVQGVGLALLVDQLIGQHRSGQNLESNYRKVPYFCSNDPQATQRRADCRCLCIAGIKTANNVWRS
jgi:two-component system chemotaxis sensor kinase CheA